MGSLSLTISYQKNTGIAISPSELIQLFFFGTQPKDSRGNVMDDETILFYIESAQKEIEDYLNIKLNKTYIIESKDFVHDDWIKWGYTKTSYPVVTPKALKGYLNTSLQVDYPTAWLKSKTQSPDKDLFHRSINIVPVTPGTIGGSSPTFYGIAPLYGLYGNKTIPNYWTQEYVTGWDSIPKDILKAIGMKASIEIFTILQDGLVGTAGVTNQSISTDGLSQSKGYNSKGIYANRIEQYNTMLNGTRDRGGLLEALEAKYVGFSFGVLG